MKALKDLVNKDRDNIIKHTCGLISIESTGAEEKPGKPFGDGVDKALKYVLDLAESMGFETVNADGFAGHADLGSSEKILGVLVHLDVVPEGSGWDFPAFKGTVHNNRIYGRGAIDNKGPAIASLYAMKALKESGAELNSKVRLIFGTNEESTSGWKDLKYYFSKYPVPETGFSPDAKFPVIYGEKGLLNFSISNSFTPDSEPVQLVSFKGGSAPNMVPDYCEAVLRVSDSGISKFQADFEQYSRKSGSSLSLEEKDGIFTVKGKGVSVHASTPEKGKNAISLVIDFLGKCSGLNASVSEFFKNYNKKIGFQVNGESIGCNIEDDISGRLTLNIGVAAGDSRKIDMKVNIRYPIKAAGNKVIEGIKFALERTGISFNLIGDAKPLYVPKDDSLIIKLMDAYREETGDFTGEPVTIGGGTYARALPKGVAFGAVFPGEEDLAHQKNEYIDIDSLMASTRIFASALYSLTR